MLRLISLAFVGLLAASTPASPSLPPPGPVQPAWAARLGTRDLAEASQARIEQALKAGSLSATAGAKLLADLKAIEADEQTLRKGKDPSAEELAPIRARLVAIADAVDHVPPMRAAVSAPTATWLDPDASQPLDLTGYALTFEDQFDRPTITADGGKGPWFSPVHADFGAASFKPPGPDFPFQLEKRANAAVPSERGLLLIRSRKAAKGWEGGLIQSVDGKGEGFAQRYGYFEVRCQLPVGKGTWPAFWLLTQDAYKNPGLDRGEIDVLEQYGSSPENLHIALHMRPPTGWNQGGLQTHWFKSKKIPLSDLTEGFHRYGVMVTPQLITYYYDGRQVARFETLEPFQRPLYLLVNLSMHPKELEQATDPSTYVIDYVRAYALPVGQGTAPAMQTGR